MKIKLTVFFAFIVLTIGYFHNVFTDRLLIASEDGLLYFYPAITIAAEQYRQGTLPLWNDHMFSGFPLMAASQPGVLYPISVILIRLLPTHLAYNLDVIIHIALAGFFTFLYARKLGNAFFPSIAAGAVFAFLGYLIPHLNHLSILHTAVWLPLVLYSFEDIRLKTDVRSALGASMPVSMQILAGHAQIYFYTYIILFLFVVFNAYFLGPGLRLRFMGLCTFAFGLGIIIGLPQLYATYELYSLGVRPFISYEVFSSGSLSLSGLLTFLFPHGYGKDAYVGVLPLLLAPITFMVWRKSIHIRFWWCVAIFSIVLALGDTIRPLHRIMFRVPLYNSFRGVSKHLIELHFALSILFAFGLSFILSDKGPHLLRRARKFHLLELLIAAVIILEILSPRSMNWPRVAEIDDYMREIFVPLAGSKGRTTVFSEGIIVPLAMRYGVDLMEGYDPLVTDEYRVLTGMSGVGGRSVEWVSLLKNNTILSLLNVRYIFVPPDASFVDNIRGEIFGDEQHPRKALYRHPYISILSTPRFKVYENLNCMPRAFGILRLVPLNNIFEIKSAFYSGLFNPATTAVVSKSDLEEIGGDSFSAGEVRVAKHVPGEAILKTDFTGQGFIVMSDQYYPGWRALIDGNPTKIYKTNGVLRGVVVPEGAHELRFRYFPLRIYSLLAVSILTVIAVIIALKLLSLKR